jgi:hypothetical protein
MGVHAVNVNILSNKNRQQLLRHRLFAFTGLLPA